MVAKSFSDKVKKALEEYAKDNHQNKFALVMLIPLEFNDKQEYVLTLSANWLDGRSAKEVLFGVITKLRKYLVDDEYLSIVQILCLHTTDKYVKKIIEESPYGDVPEEKYYYQRVSNFIIRDHLVPEVFILMFDKNLAALAA